MCSSQSKRLNIAGCKIKFYVHEVSEKIWLCEEKNRGPQVSEKKTKHLKTTWTG